MIGARGALSLRGVAKSIAPTTGGAERPAVKPMSASEAFADRTLMREWDLLANQASEPNPFMERWYIEPALSHVAPADVEIIAVHDGGLMGIIALHGEANYAGLPLRHRRNWLNHNAFLGTPLVRKGGEIRFWQLLLAHLDTLRGSDLFLHLSGLPTEGPMAAALGHVCRAERRRFALVHREERALLEHGLAPEAYLETHVRGKKRKELRRQHKRLAEEGMLAFERLSGTEALDAWVDEFLALERAGWKGTNGSALSCAPGTEALFRHCLHGAAAAGKLERLALRLDGRAIAMLATFLSAPGAYSFKTAFDEDYARFSPGVLLQIENLALLERSDILWCDSCAAADHPMIDSLWAGRRNIGRYSVAIGGTARRVAFAALLTAERTKAKIKGRAST